jgi:uncharacterized cupredoxin-like copper-binding protein
MNDVQEMFPNGTVDANVCWSIKTSDAKSLLVYVDYGYSGDDRRFFALKRDKKSAVVLPTATLSAAPQAVEIELLDIQFEPNVVTIPANTDVTVSLPNTGVTLHNFSIDELNIDVDVQPSHTGSTTINAPAGTYQFYCDVPGHKEAGMIGTLVVQ